MGEQARAQAAPFPNTSVWQVGRVFLVRSTAGCEYHCCKSVNVFPRKATWPKWYGQFPTFTAAHFHPGIKANGILFFVVKVAQMVIADIKLGYLAARYYSSISMIWYPAIAVQARPGSNVIYLVMVNFSKPNEYIETITNMREWKSNECRDKLERKPQPSNLFYQSTIIDVSTVGGGGGSAAALVAWDRWHRLIPSWQWGRNKRDRGGGWVTKNASCSELEDEDASCSEHRASQILGVGGSRWASGSPVRA